MSKNKNIKKTIVIRKSVTILSLALLGSGAVFPSLTSFASTQEKTNEVAPTVPSLTENNKVPGLVQTTPPSEENQPASSETEGTEEKGKQEAPESSTPQSSSTEQTKPTEASTTKSEVKAKNVSSEKEQVSTTTAHASKTKTSKGKVSNKKTSVSPDQATVLNYGTFDSATGNFTVTATALTGTKWNDDIQAIGKANIKKITFTQKTSLDAGGIKFGGLSALTSIEGLDNVDTSNVTDMMNMFAYCHALTSLDLSNFNTSKVTNMQGMFYNSAALTSLDFSHFNTSNVTNMQGMFQNCNALTSLDLSAFDTSKVTDMSWMFNGCTSLTSLDLSTFDTSNVTNMSLMFQNCNALTSLDLSAFDTSNVTTMYSMFQNCNALTSLDLSNFNTSNVTIMSAMFNGCTNLGTDGGSLVLGTKFTPKNGVALQGTSKPGHTGKWVSVGKGTPLDPEKNITFSDSTDFITHYKGNTQAGAYVQESLAPIINIKDTTINKGTQWAPQDNFISAKDSEGKTLSLADLKVTPSTVDTSKPGKHDVVYSYTDPTTKLETTATAHVTVIDNTAQAPELQVKDTTIAKNTHWSAKDNFVSAKNSEGKAVDFKDVKVTGSVGSGRVGTYDIVYSYTDPTTQLKGAATAHVNVANPLSLNYGTFDYATGNFTVTASALTGTKWNDDIKAIGAANIKKITFTQKTSLDAGGIRFEALSALTTIEGLENVDTSKVTNMQSMFNGCSALTSLDLSNFNTSKVTSMNSMFNKCSSLTSLDLSNFDTSKAANINLGGMFAECSSLTKLDLSHWDTSNVTNMIYMFSKCTALTDLDVSNFDTSNVTDMHYMFYNCSALTNLNISSFDTSKANVDSLFKATPHLGTDGGSLVLGTKFTTKNKKGVALQGTSKPGHTGKWVSVGKGTPLDPEKNITFSDSTDFITHYEGNTQAGAYVQESLAPIINIKDTTINKGTQWAPQDNFISAKDSEGKTLSLADLKVTPNTVDTSKPGKHDVVYSYTDPTTKLEATATAHVNVVNPLNYGTFDYATGNFKVTATALTETKWNDDIKAIGAANIKKITFTQKTSLDAGGIKFGDWKGNALAHVLSSLTSIEGLENVDTSNVTTMQSMFAGCSALTSLDLSNFNTSKVTDMNHMFLICKALTSLDVSHFDTSNVTNMSVMFGTCLALTSLDVSNFDTSNVTDMTWMFAGCETLKSLDVSHFNTSNVTDMSFMFEDCSALTNLDLSNFNASNVTTMTAMFIGCSALKSLDLSNFDTSNVTDMCFMFEDCSALTNLDLSNFDTSNVTDMWNMFFGCTALTDLDLSNFNTSNVTDMTSMFEGCSALTNLDLSSFDTSKANVNSLFNATPHLGTDGGSLVLGTKFIPKNGVALQRTSKPGHTGKWVSVGKGTPLDP
ncbi:BspA family leucine-rich repeat surface protein, partial [Lactococcus garvieae]